MAKKRTPPEEPKPPLLLAVPREEAERRITERIEKATALKKASITSFESLESAERDYKTWSSYNTELLKRLFTSPELSEEYARYYGGGIAFIGEGRSLGKEINEYQEKIDDKVHRLESIRERLELIPESPGAAPAAPRDADTVRPAETNRVFVVHGHDEAARETCARFLERLRLEPVILHEQASAGRTIIEKLEHHGDVGFAVVLLTPDDVGAVKTQRDALQPRARQNVVLELGYFVGRLGRSRVCALHKSPMELPSDFVGVVYVPFDDAGGWRLILARELKNAGFSIDMNEVI